MDIEQVLKARVKAVYVPPMIDDLQETFVVNVEFEPRPGEKIGVYQPVFMTREERVRGQRDPKSFEARVIDQACGMMARWLLRSRAELEYLESLK